MPIKAPVVDRGDSVAETIFPARKKEMSRADLQRALAPVIAHWIGAACLWDNDAPAVGDHRFVIFSVNIAPKVRIYVQFWSEPLEAVLWEVSSGKWNPPTEKWLAGDGRARRIEAFGFEIGGEAGNYQREDDVETPADVMRLARQVVDILYTACDYRGLRPVKAQLTYESRGEARLVYDSFTPEDLARIMEACGFKVEEAGDNEDAPLLRAVRRGIVTTVTCDDRVPDEHLFQRAILTTDLELPSEDLNAITDAVRAQIGEPEAMHLGTSLVFDGGVTAQWVVQRIIDWDAMTWSSRKAARRRKEPSSTPRNVRVH